MKYPANQLTIFFLLSFSSIVFGQYQPFNHDGQNRQYLYYAPSNLPPNAPLVMMIHGYSGDASSIESYAGMNAVADSFGFAVCYPRGTKDASNNRFFNVGYDFHLGVETVDDIDFLETLARHLQAVFDLDSNRTYAAGFSNGGDICYKLACEGSGVFKAFAPIAGMILQNIQNNNTSYEPVPILEVHGTLDNVTYYGGDMTNQGGWGAYPSIPSTITYFSNLNNCTQTTTDTLPNLVTTDGSYVIREKHYVAGSSCNQVWLYKVEGGEHDWPNAWGNMDINTSMEIYKFFQEVYCSPNLNINSPEPNTSIRLYPNPVSNILTIEFAEYLEKETLTVYNSQGQLIQKTSIDGTLIELDTKEFFPGLYILWIRNQAYKFIKQAP